MTGTKNKLGTLRARLWWASLPLCFGGLLLFDMALRYFYRFAGAPAFWIGGPLPVFSRAWCLLLTGLAALLPPGARILMGISRGSSAC